MVAWVHINFLIHPKSQSAKFVEVEEMISMSSRFSGSQEGIVGGRGLGSY